MHNIRGEKEKKMTPFGWWRAICWRVEAEAGREQTESDFISSVCSFISSSEFFSAIWL